MLRHLSITNYAIIEHVDLNFNDGFTVITGETGAGKSILIGALSLILGKRADTSVLNNKQKKCIVEGEFVFQKDKFLNFFNAYDLDYEDVNLIRREVSSNGKSRAFINDSPVSLSILKELTSRLVDIHSQHQTLELKEDKFQIKVVDAFSGSIKKQRSYTKQYETYLKNRLHLRDLIAQSKNAKADLDYITFQINEIEELNLKPNEKEVIEAELDIINNAEEIKSVLDKSGNVLLNSDKTVLVELKSLVNSFSKIKDCSDKYNAFYERLNSALIELEDIAREIDKENNELDFNPENLVYLNDRLANIFSIEQKHGLSSTQEIVELLDQLRLKLDYSNSNEEKIHELTLLVEEQDKNLFKLASELSNTRQKNFKPLTETIVSNLELLGMPDVSFNINHQTLNEINENGLDKIEFLFSSNKGVSPIELGKVASGGELSRLMLTIKSILADNEKLATIIFDEIDSGVSGDIADKMAEIMKKMSVNMQVIAITHLPQVAAKGSTHYKIYKENKGGKTFTSLTLLNQIERVEELTKMLSGKELSDAARENAKTLLKT